MRKIKQSIVLHDRFEVISATDFRKSPGEVFESVRLGKIFLVTKAGEPIAVISQPPGTTLAIVVEGNGSFRYEPCGQCSVSSPAVGDTVNPHELGFCCRFACGETCVGCGDAENGNPLTPPAAGEEG